MLSWLSTAFQSTSSFMPHGMCYLWVPSLLWLHVVSDTLIGAAYLGISVLLYVLVRKIRLPFSPEDEPDIRETLREILELEGFAVSTAENGQEALDLLGRIRKPCLMLLDLVMPVMNGWQFLEVLRSEHRHILATIPIVVVSAISDVSEVEQQYGCTIVKKPADIGLLVELAHKHCKLR